MSSDLLVQKLRRLWRAPRPQGPLENQPPRPEPCCPFAALLEQRQSELERAIEEVKGRVNGLLFLLAGTVLTQVVLKLMG